MALRRDIRTNGIRWHRLRLGLTQRQLAALVGAGAQEVGRWERGERAPNAEVTARLAEVLKCNPDLLTKAVEKRKEAQVDHTKALRAAAASRRPARYWMDEPS